MTPIYDAIMQGTGVCATSGHVARCHRVGLRARLKYYLRTEILRLQIHHDYLARVSSSSRINLVTTGKEETCLSK